MLMHLLLHLHGMISLLLLLLLLLMIVHHVILVAVKITLIVHGIGGHGATTALPSIELSPHIGHGVHPPSTSSVVHKVLWTAAHVGVVHHHIHGLLGRGAPAMLLEVAVGVPAHVVSRPARHVGHVGGHLGHVVLRGAGRIGRAGLGRRCSLVGAHCFYWGLTALYFRCDLDEHCRFI